MTLPRHLERTIRHMAIYYLARGERNSGDHELRNWAKSLIQIASPETIKEILVYLYTKDFPYESAVKILNDRSDYVPVWMVQGYRSSQGSS